MYDANELVKLLFYLYESGVAEGMHYAQLQRDPDRYYGYGHSGRGKEKEVDYAVHVINGYLDEAVMELTSDESFRDACKQRTDDTKKCEHCKDRFLCWTE